MPFQIADRVRETSTTTGTGNFTLAGAVAGFRTFASALSVSDTTMYAIVHQSLTEWEVGIGTLSGSTTLARTTVLASSNAGSLVNFSVGTKDAFVTPPAGAPVTLRNVLPEAPTADRVALFARSIAGRLLPAVRGPSGLSTALQPLMGRNKVSLFAPTPGSTTVTTLGLNVSATATATAASISSTNLHQSMVRIDYLQTTPSTTAIAGLRATNLHLWRGNAAGLGGFTVIMRYGPATGTSVSTRREFAGLINSTATPTDVNPSTLTNIIGVGLDAADSNHQIMHNDASGTATKIDLGASFPRATTDRTAVHELALFAPPNASYVNWQFTDLVSGGTASGQITTDLPSNTTFLAGRVWNSVGGTSSVIGSAVCSFYFETDL